MEAAFCAYQGKGSEMLSQVLRGLQLAAWVLALVKWLWFIAIKRPETPRAVALWAAGGALCAVIIWAELASMRELRRERRYVRHEMLKAKNNIVAMMARMFGTILFVRTFPVSSPLARVLVGGYSLVFDRIRVSQSLRLQTCNLLCYVPMELANWNAGAQREELVKETFLTITCGLLGPLLLLQAVLEGRARIRFLRLHTHLPQAEEQLPRPWQRLARTLRWRRADGAEFMLCDDVPPR